MTSSAPVYGLNKYMCLKCARIGFSTPEDVLTIGRVVCYACRASETLVECKELGNE